MKINYRERREKHSWGGVVVVVGRETTQRQIHTDKSTLSVEVEKEELREDL